MFRCTPHCGSRTGSSFAKMGWESPIFERGNTGNPWHPAHGEFSSQLFEFEDSATCIHRIGYPSFRDLSSETKACFYETTHEVGLSRNLLALCSLPSTLGPWYQTLDQLGKEQIPSHVYKRVSKAGALNSIHFLLIATHIQRIFVGSSPWDTSLCRLVSEMWFWSQAKPIPRAPERISSQKEGVVFGKWWHFFLRIILHELKADFLNYTFRFTTHLLVAVIWSLGVSSKFWSVLSPKSCSSHQNWFSAFQPSVPWSGTEENLLALYLWSESTRFHLWNETCLLRRGAGCAEIGTRNSLVDLLLVLRVDVSHRLTSNV